jgi:hypothetical protein
MLFLLLTHTLSAQEVREISTATRLRREPGGIALASLPAGTSVEPKRSRGDWHEVEVEGWIFTRSTQRTNRDGFDLVVSSPGGENIRQAPNGQVVAQIREGTLLLKDEVQGGWTRVRRTGWVPRTAMASAAPTAPKTAVQSSIPESRDDSAPVETGAITPLTPPEQTAPPQPQARAPAEPNRSATNRAEVTRETAMFAAPEEGQFGTIQAGASARVLGRSGDWTRVQLEGWVRDSDLKGGPQGALTGITAAEVRADPPSYIGRTVDWRLELIAVQTADELRTEMTPGQLYLLTRGPLPEPGFVYVTVSEEQATEFRAMQALQDLVLRVVIKAPRTRFLATPVVQLVSIVPEEAGS